METSNFGTVTMRYELWRNVTTTEKAGNKISQYVGIVQSDQLLTLLENENVRGFLGAPDKPSGNVQKSIHETLEERPQDFSLLNGGLTIVARDTVIDTDRKQIQLIKASIINGSQTRGTIKAFHETYPSNPPIEVKVEVIVSSDEDLITDISISRNVQIAVKPASITGRQGGFDPFNEAIVNANKIRKHGGLQPYLFEVDTNESEKDGINPLFALQLSFLMIPKNLWTECFPKIKYGKHAVYNSSAKILKLYNEHVFDPSKDTSHERHAEGLKMLKFLTSIFPVAYTLYRDWNTQEAWKATKIVTGISKASGKTLKVSNAWSFPILAGHSAFVTFDNTTGEADYSKDSRFDDRSVVEEMSQLYNKVAKGNLNSLGKDEYTYDRMEDFFATKNYILKSGI